MKLCTSRSLDFIARARKSTPELGMHLKLQYYDVVFYTKNAVYSLKEKEGGGVEKELGHTDLLHCHVVYWRYCVR